MTKTDIFCFYCSKYLMVNDQENLMSYLSLFSYSKIVKSYTKLILVSEPEIAQLMAKISFNLNLSSETSTLGSIVQAINQWYISGFPVTTITLLEKLENLLTIIDIDETDTSDKLIKEFFEAVNQNKLS